MDNLGTVTARRYRGQMRLVKTGRNDSEVVEVYDTKYCSSCDAEMKLGNYRIGTLNCTCAGGRSHRVIACKACGTKHYEPAHVIQAGPTADYGGVTTHPATSA